MKCALIIPSWKPEDIFPPRTAGSQINYWQPLGTLYVASSLQKAGHEVKFINGAFMTSEDILKDIKAYNPEFVGFYSTAFGWSRTKVAAADIKKICDRAFICVGGPYVIAMQEKSLKDKGAEAIDAVVTGEGEMTVPEILDCLQQGRSLSGVKGVIFRDGDFIVKNPPRPLINDLDSIPFPNRELLGDKNLYVPPPATYKRKPVAVMLTSRGCNRRCIYCFQMDKGRKSGIRYRSVENVMQEIELVLSQGFREIKFLDDTFAADYNRAMQIAHEIKARGLKFTWFVSACVNQVDKPLLEAFREAGCWAILFGAESGVQKNLNAIRKGITLEQTRKAVRAAKEAGLKVITPFIFGIPGETFEEGLKTIEFALELDPHIANFHAIAPFPGSELYDNAEKYGTISEELTDYTYQGAAFVPHTMSRDDIIKLRLIAFRRFYSRPKFLLRRFIQIRSVYDVRAAFKGVKSLFWLWASRSALEVRKEKAGKLAPRTS
ncbi:MAG: B12-binding domain-containing radical SAM protein [Firmicutes bacterium]|nr:B12-binding domain-containing radical SAM protein [Bacillota bacterium]